MPTLNLEVAAGADDAHEIENGTGFNATGDTLGTRFHTSDASRKHVGVRFSGVTIPVGSTIDTATFSITSDNPARFKGVVYAEDVDDADNFTTTADLVNRTKTTANVTWDTGINLNEATSPDIAAVIQEIIDREGWGSGNAIMIILWSDDDQDGVESEWWAWEGADGEGDSSLGAQLDITYTEVTGQVNSTIYRFF